MPTDASDVGVGADIEQKSNSTLQELRTSTSLQLQQFPAPFNNKRLYCDITLDVPRSYIPPTLRKSSSNTYSFSHTPSNELRLSSSRNALSDPK